MNVDETVKALRGECKALCKDGLGKNCLGCEYIGEELMHPYYRCNLQIIAADQLEQLQAENEMLKSGNKQIIDDYKLCIAERDNFQAVNERFAIIIDKYQGEVVPRLNEEIERLKSEKPVQCGECKYYEHSELEGVNSHCGRMDGGICGHDLKPWEFCSYGIRRDAE